MKRQPGWIAVILAVLIALFGMETTVRAQTADDSSFIKTYYADPVAGFTDASLVLRLIRQGQGPGYQVSGLFFAPATVASPALLFGISGEFNADSGSLAADLAVPRGLQELLKPVVVDGTLNGAYHAPSNTLDLALTVRQQGTVFVGPARIIAGEYTGDLPYVVGIWQWLSASSPELLASAPTYSGEFFILRQSPEGAIVGAFGQTNLQDVGTIKGEVTPDAIHFVRAGTFNGLDFAQTWKGSVSNNGQAMRGKVAQTIPSDWSGDFSAHR
jgi:hypothetical protein